MPISIVVGGQFGSEGKGKVALEVVRCSQRPATVVRVGGPNSGHTAYDRRGTRWALRQMPASCIDLNVDVVFPAGSYIDVGILFSEIAALNYPPDRIFISNYANIVTNEHKDWEIDAGLSHSIGSTGSGVGGAVMAVVAREAANFPLRAVHAEHDARLQRFLIDTSSLLSDALWDGQRVVIEGSQGFGLSLLEGGHWPKATSRSTSAAGALAEAGLSPRYVDDIVMVLRSFPIRVAGDSGPLFGETTWAEISRRAGHSEKLTEYTTVTKKVRRVGEFDPSIVRRAIACNDPHRIVLNHMDYIGDQRQLEDANSNVRKFLDEVEFALGRRIDCLGFSGYSLVPREERVG